MPRLFDYVRRWPLSRGMFDIQLDDESVGSLRKAMKDSTIIVADNVAEYVHSATDQEYWNPDDYPNLAPPFQKFWVEFKTPRVTVSEKFGKHKNPVDKVPYAGAFVNTVETEQGWSLSFTYFFGGREGTYGPLGVNVVSIDKNGLAIGDTDRWGTFICNAEQTYMRPREIQSLIGSLGIPIMMAISFMHCKNVVVERHTNPRRRSKQGLKEHGFGLVDYFVLDIDPMKEILARAGNADEYGLKRALHICRGHFRDYRDGPGLFGKHKVMIWVPDHAKGSASRGIKLKDYEVNPPKEGDTDVRG